MVVSRNKIVLLPMLTVAVLSSRGQSFRAGPTILRIASRLHTDRIPNVLHDSSFQASSGASRASRYNDGSARRQPRNCRTFLSSTTRQQLPEIDAMRAGQIKEELESYGISTKSFLEKSELVDALQKARTEGLQPKQPPVAAPSSATSSTSTGSAASTSSTTASPSGSSTKSREDRLADELVQCQAMKATDLKKELQERGISTAALFEKSEFVRAVAEARVDNVSRRSTAAAGAAEGYAEYTNVEVLTDDAAGPRQKQQKQPEPSSASPFGRGSAGTPFGGGASGNPFGGMGGMGNIADMLKNMGMGGMGGGANPFRGGGGGNPFGGGAGANPFAGGGGGGMNDVMGKAQEMMQNPKVQELMRKAQSNPLIMAKVNECMTNPAAFVKYQNDPDVAELISELRKYM